MAGLLVATRQRAYGMAFLALAVRDATLDQFLADLSARTPAPGGGSVAALCGALGAALGVMAARFTTGKRYADRAESMQQLAAGLEEPMRFLAAAVARDAAAYDAVSAAMKLPAEDPARAPRLREATLRAMDVPLEVMHTAAAVLEQLAPAAEHGFNANLASDVAVCGWTLLACTEGAYRNVVVNALGLPGDAEAQARLQRAAALRGQAQALAGRVCAAGDKLLQLEA